jgi:hypothetical protein
LRCIRDENDDEQVGRTEVPGLPAPDEPQDSEKTKYMSVPRTTMSAIPRLGTNTLCQSTLI